MDAGPKATVGYNRFRVSKRRSAQPHAAPVSYDSRNLVKTYADPLGNFETYNCDGNGNLISKVDRKNQTTTFGYDGVDRLTINTHADNSSITIS